MTSLDFIRNVIEQGEPDVLRSVLERVVDEHMEAEVDALCGAGRGERR
jgi:transposase-like protein